MAQCDTGNKKPSYMWYHEDRNSMSTAWTGRNWKGFATGHAGISSKVMII